MTGPYSVLKEEIFCADKHLTAERLRSLLNYDPETGIFTWIESRNGHVRAGDVAGTIQRYLKIGLDHKVYAGHRLAWLYMTDEWPPHQVDHRDLNKSNNRWGNLRLATHSQNQGNRRHSLRGLKGTSFRKRSGKWCAQIAHKMLGEFNCPAAAHFAYVIAASKKFGEFARFA